MISRDSLQVVGHRGWPGRFPDNTMAGFAAAASVADMVETDVRRCGDGRLVLAHDSHLGGLDVASTNWSELCAVDLGGGLGPALLDEALATFPGLPFNLEIKNHPVDSGFEPGNEIASETADRARPGDLLSSFYWPAMDRVRSTHPEVDTGLLVDGSGSLPDAITYATENEHRAVNPHWFLVMGEPHLVGEAKSRGLLVMAWTVNEWTMAKDLAALGVDGIITDDPGGLRTALGTVED